MNASTALEAYKATKTQAGIIDEASPHQLVAMLLDGALQRIAEARGAIERIEKLATASPPAKSQLRARQ